MLGLTLPGVAEQYDRRMLTKDDAVKNMYRAGSAGIRTTRAFSQDCRWDTLDDDRAEGCVRSLEHAYSKDGVWPPGTVTLRKMAVSPENRWRGRQHPEICTGPAKVYESRGQAVDAHLGGKAW